MNREFLNDVREYIESTEKLIEGEWGHCRSLKELIDQEDMPEIYYKVLHLLDACTEDRM